MKIVKITAILFLLAHYSCNDFLNVQPEGEIVNNELFQHAEGFEDALYGVYAQLAGSSFYGRTMTYYLNDILAQYYCRGGLTDTTLKICSYQYQDQMVRPTINRIWSGMYKNIGYVNNILNNLEKYNPGDFAYYRVYQAECLGLRAFMHFELLRLFTENFVNNPSAQGIPYNENYSYEVPAFLSAANTYDKIIEELKKAESLLVENGEYFHSGDVNLNGFLKDRHIHMNLHAIQSTLARVYWTKGEMKNAADYALKVIGSGVFQLASNLEIENLMNGIISQKETIWGLYSNNMYASVEKDLFQYDRGLLLKQEHESNYMVDKEGVDYRYESWFKYYSSSALTNGLRCIKIFDTYRLEYRQREAVPGLSIIRLPELYYIVAEYYLTLNDQVNAMKYLDEVVKSRGLTPFSERQGVTLTIDHLIRERKKELICEGQYFHTLKRYHLDVYESQSGQSYKASNAIYVFPIPDDEVNYRN